MLGDTVGSNPHDVLWKQLPLLVTLRTQDGQMAWRAFGAFWQTNGVLLIPYVLQATTSLRPLIAAAGIAVAVAWWVAEYRLLQHIRRYDEAILNIERELQLDSNITISPELDPDRSRRYLGGGLSTKTTILACAVLWFTAWVFAEGVAFRSVLDASANRPQSPVTARPPVADEPTR